jgi:preprotein translocase subunit YajC
MFKVRLLFFVFFFFSLKQSLLFAQADESVVVDHSPKETPSGATPLTSGSYYLFLMGLFVMMWFFVMRPQKKQQKEKENLLQSLSAGQQITTTGGLIGRVVNVHDQYVVLDLGQSVVKVLKSSITGLFNSQTQATATSLPSSNNNGTKPSSKTTS